MLASKSLCQVSRNFASDSRDCRLTALKISSARVMTWDAMHAPVNKVAHLYVTVAANECCALYTRFDEVASFAASMIHHYQQERGSQGQDQDLTNEGQGLSSCSWGALESTAQD